jgi:myo-inositol-1(or 4)-monophosphatase
VSISLGFTIDRHPVVGVIYNPFTGTLYSAIKGQGAYKTPRAFESTPGSKQRLPLRDEKLERLNQSLIAIEWGSDRSGPNYECKIATFANLNRAPDASNPDLKAGMVHSSRSLGSAALNLCGVAEGCLDAYWEGGCWAWDVAAGWCILEEAGGRMVDGNPGKWEQEVTGRTYLATRKGVQKHWIEEFWGCVDGSMQYEH